VSGVLYFKKADLTKGFNPKKGQHVTFKFAVDDKGAGAYDIY